MKVAIIAITKSGKRMAKILTAAFSNGSKSYSLTSRGDLKSIVGKIFDKDKFDGIVFIMSLGIVVRVIAPYLKDKYRDPAVVVVNETNQFAISALSGHEGGANKLVLKVANILDAQPVITTASESRKDVIIGIGCRRGVGKNKIIKAIRYGLKRARCPMNKVRYVATVELKKSEPGIIEACEELGIPLRIISLAAVENFKGVYQRSAFVKEKIGVEGVSEPCALLAERKTKLILPKIKLTGVTVAITRLLR